MKRIAFLLLLTAPFLRANATRAQGWSPTTAEEAKVISVLGLAPGKVVGEIGAGDGQLTIKVAKAVIPGGKVYATELGAAKRDALKRNVAEAGAVNVEVLDAQIATTGLAPGCCDAVFMRDVYHHLTSPDEILADIKKALRPSGTLLIIDFEPRTSLSNIEGVRENRGGHGIPMGVMVHELTKAGFEVLTKDAAWREDLYAVVARVKVAGTPTKP